MEVEESLINLWVGGGILKLRFFNYFVINYSPHVLKNSSTHWKPEKKPKKKFQHYLNVQAKTAHFTSICLIYWRIYESNNKFMVILEFSITGIMIHMKVRSIQFFKSSLGMNLDQVIDGNGRVLWIEFDGKR